MENFLEQLVYSFGFTGNFVNLSGPFRNRRNISIETYEIAFDHITVNCGIKRVDGAVTYAVVEIEMPTGDATLSCVGVNMTPARRATLCNPGLLLVSKIRTSAPREFNGRDQHQRS